MGLKIITPIGTDQGITNEAYVRISSYSLNKDNGNASFAIQIYNSKDIFLKEKESILSMYSIPINGSARNNEIGNVLNLSLTKKITKTVIVSKPVSKTVDVTETVTVLDAEGNPQESTDTRKEVRIVYEDTPEEITIDVVDLTPLEDVNIFTFAYSKLKEKLQGLFGDNEVIDA